MHVKSKKKYSKYFFTQALFGRSLHVFLILKTILNSTMLFHCFIYFLLIFQFFVCPFVRISGAPTNYMFFSLSIRLDSVLLLIFNLILIHYLYITKSSKSTKSKYFFYTDHSFPSVFIQYFFSFCHTTFLKTLYP